MAYSQGRQINVSCGRHVLVLPYMGFFEGCRYSWDTATEFFKMNDPRESKVEATMPVLTKFQMSHSITSAISFWFHSMLFLFLQEINKMESIMQEIYQGEYLLTKREGSWVAERTDYVSLWGKERGKEGRVSGVSIFNCSAILRKFDNIAKKSWC